MKRFKDLEFNTANVDLDAEVVRTALVIKVFHLYQTRNEWTNWSGDTDLVNRTGRRFDLSLKTCKESAEKQRTQGTSFTIDEAPALCVLSNQYALLATELFSKNPLSDCMSKTTSHVISLRQVESNLKSGRWFTSAVYTGDPKKLVRMQGDEIFHSHRSHSAGGGARLTWPKHPKNFNLEKLIQYAKSIELASS